jgi:Ion channel
MVPPRAMPASGRVDRVAGEPPRVMATGFPAFRRTDTAQYLAVLLLILAAIGFQVAASDSEWARLVIVVLESFTLYLALSVGRIHGALDRILLVLIAAAVAVSVIALAGFATLGEFDARVINLLLIAFAPVALSIGLLDDMRSRSRVTVRTVIGVLSVYLLIGLIFTFVFGIVGAQASSPFFKYGVGGTSSNYLYFSYSTLTTVGYGDLVAELQIGRSFAIIEALVGQMYLVSIVALIVGSLGRLPTTHSTPFSAAPSKRRGRSGR